MKVPKANEVLLTCLICKIDIHPNKNFEDCDVNIACWNHATVSMIFPSLKSSLEGKGFVVAICDECLRVSVMQGIALQFYNKLEVEELPIS